MSVDLPTATPDPTALPPPADIALLRAHYLTAAPLMEHLVGPIPFIWTTAPSGPGNGTFYHGPLSDVTLPHLVSGS